jgi:hypothetical protein
VGISVAFDDARIAAATAASSSSGRSIVGTAPDIIGRYLSSKEKVEPRPWRSSHSGNQWKLPINFSSHFRTGRKGRAAARWIERSGFDVGSSSSASEPYSRRGCGFNSRRRAISRFESPKFQSWIFAISFLASSRNTLATWNARKRTIKVAINCPPCRSVGRNLPSI